MPIVGAIVGIVISAAIGGLVIWIVARFGLGLEVDGFVPAFLAAIIIAVVAGLINWLLGLLGITIGGGLLGAIIHLIIAAVVLMISSSIVPGMRVKGFGGALVAAIAIAILAWLVGLVVGALGLG